MRARTALTCVGSPQHGGGPGRPLPFAVEPSSWLRHDGMMGFSSPSITRTMMQATPLLMLLGSCVGPAPRPVRPVVESGPRPSSPSATAVPVQRPAPAPLAVEWQYRPATSGTWTYRADGAGSVAQFGPSATDIRFAIRCDRAARQVRFARAGSGQGAMVVRTSYGAVSWPTAPAPGAQPMIVAVRASNDGTLDQIAYSRGRFAVEMAGMTPLYLPAWGEVSRVIEDCRG